MEYIFPILSVILFLTLAVIMALIYRRSSRPPHPPHPSGPPRPPRPPSLDNSPLALIPPEIIQHIVSYLPPSAAASLALCCLLIRLGVGTQYLCALRASRAETVALLELIVADLPNDPLTGTPKLLLCVHCARLVPSSRKCGEASTPACKQAFDFSRKHLDKSFQPALFHTAMAMHRHGRSASKLLAQLTPRSTFNRSPCGTNSHNFVDYYIQSGSLRRREQLVMVIPRGALYNYTIARSPCAHTRTYQRETDNATVSVQEGARYGMHRSTSDFIGCKYCRTVVHVGACKFRAGSIGIFLTWWSDLGDGRLGDEKWAEYMRYSTEEEWRVVSYYKTDVTPVTKHPNEFYFNRFDELIWTR